MSEPDDRPGMTEEQWAWFQKFTQGYGDQDENRTDLSLLRANFKLTPTERIRALERDLAPSAGTGGPAQDA